MYTTYVKSGSEKKMEGKDSSKKFQDITVQHKKKNIHTIINTKLRQCCYCIKMNQIKMLGAH
jgi:hypothetical protein